MSLRLGEHRAGGTSRYGNIGLIEETSTWGNMGLGEHQHAPVEAATGTKSALSFAEDNPYLMRESRESGFKHNTRPQTKSEIDMALRLVGEENLCQLLGWLKHQQPASTPLYRYVRLYVEEKFAELDVLVDQWPEPRVAACVISQERSQQPSKDFFKHIILSMFSTSEESVANFLSITDCVDWNKEVFLFALSDAAYLAAQKLPGVIEAFPGIVLRATTDDLKPLPIPEGIKLSAVSEKSTDLVHSTWKLCSYQIHSRPFVTDLIQTQPSILMTTTDNRHVGHMLGYPGGFMGMLHVFPEFRRKGYAKVIITHLAQKLFESGRQEVYIIVEESNTASLELHKSVGFKVVTNIGAVLFKPWSICNSVSSAVN